MQVPLHLKPLTVTAPNLNQSAQPGNQKASEEYGCEEQKSCRKHIHGKPPQSSGPLWHTTKVRTNQVYTFESLEATNRFIQRRRRSSATKEERIPYTQRLLEEDILAGSEPRHG